MAVLVAVAGVIITAREPGENIVKSFFNFHSIGGLAFDWAYKFYFLKYLFIVIPGMWAGELFLVVNSKTHEAYSFKNSIWSILTLGLFLVVVNAAILMLLADWSDMLDVTNFWSAVLAAIVISVVTRIVSGVAKKALPL